MTGVIRPAIAEQAVEWMMELQSPPVTPEKLAQWQCWLQQDPQHALAWQRVEAFGERLSGLGAHAPIVHAALATPSDSRLDRRTALKALVLAVSAGALAWSGRDSDLWQNLNADYRSGVGEQRYLTLLDGSRLMLNTDTAVDVRFDPAVRQVQLLRGEVHIQVAADKALRPFQAYTTQGSVVTQRGDFLLRQDSAFSRLAVTEGVVMLSPERLVAVRVEAGQQVTFTRDEIGPLRQLTEADQAWTAGLLMAVDMPLGHFVRELGRYRHGHLGCARSLADIRVAGTYPLADTERILQTLAVSLDIEVRRFTPYWVTLEPKRTIS